MGSAAAAAAALSPDDALERTLGNGTYQACLFAIVGLMFNSWGFAFMLLPVFTDLKLAADPSLPTLTTESLALTSTALYFGWLVGSAAVGSVMDAYGRRRTVLGGALGLGLGSLALVAAPSVAAWAGGGLLLLMGAARFLVGISSNALSVALVLLQESIPAAWRSRAVAALNTAYSLLAAAMAVACGTATRGLDWRAEVLLWCLPPVLVAILAGLPLVQESLPYLAGRRRAEEAAEVVTRIARWNGDESLACPATVAAAAGTEVGAAAPNGGDAGKAAAGGAGGFSELLRPPLLGRLLALAGCFVACGLGFYGLSYSAGGLSDDVYANSAYLSLADILGYGLSVGADAFGKRLVQGAAFSLAGACLLLCGALAAMGGGGPGLLACAVVGRVCLNVCFCTVYVYAVELFPVACRGAAFSACQLAARLGGVFAPLCGTLAASVSCPVFGLFCVAAAAATFGMPEIEDDA